MGGRLVRESWEIVEAKDRISSIELFDHMANRVRRGAKKEVNMIRRCGGGTIMCNKPLKKRKDVSRIGKEINFLF